MACPIVPLIERDRADGLAPMQLAPSGVAARYPVVDGDVTSVARPPAARGSQVTPKSLRLILVGPARRRRTCRSGPYSGGPSTSNSLARDACRVSAGPLSDRVPGSIFFDTK